MGLPEKPQRPGGESEALEVSLAGDTTNDSRCRVCGHRLWAKRSVSEGIGPECRRRTGRPARRPSSPNRVVPLRGALVQDGSLPPPRPTPLAWTCSYLAAQLREELPSLRLHLLTMEERAKLETALAAATREVDNALDASNVRGGWLA